jgi:hypothetical protein
MRGCSGWYPKMLLLLLLIIIGSRVLTCLSAFAAVPTVWGEVWFNSLIQLNSVRDIGRVINMCYDIEATSCYFLSLALSLSLLLCLSPCPSYSPSPPP